MRSAVRGGGRGGAHSGVVQIETLAAEQNRYLLSLLEREQINENARERLYQSTDDPIEKRRLEKIFGVERAKGIQRSNHRTTDQPIQRLSHCLCVWCGAVQRRSKSNRLPVNTSQCS